MTTELFSAFLGAIVGGCMTLVATWYAQKKSWEREMQKRELDQKETQRIQREMDDAELRGCLFDYLFYIEDSNLKSHPYALLAHREEMRQRLQIEVLMSRLDLDKELEENIRKILRRGRSKAHEVLTDEQGQIIERLKQPTSPVDKVVWKYISGTDEGECDV